MRVATVLIALVALVLCACSSGERLTEDQKDRRSEALFAGELSD